MSDNPTLPEALDAYHAWRDEGRRLHAALLTIWRALAPDRKHMTFGDDPDVVVREVLDALSAQVSTPSGSSTDGGGSDG